MDRSDGGNTSLSGYKLRTECRTWKHLLADEAGKPARLAHLLVAEIDTGSGFIGADADGVDGSAETAIGLRPLG